MTTVISVRGKDRKLLIADPNFVYVGRRCAGWPASIWGNPFRSVPGGGVQVDYRRVDREWFRKASFDGVGILQLYERWLNTNVCLILDLPRLYGKTLGCWCGSWRPGEPEIPCHAVVLAKLADAP